METNDDLRERLDLLRKIERLEKQISWPSMNDLEDRLKMLREITKAA